MEIITYSVKDVSFLCNVTEETVRRWIRSGKLKASKKSNKEGYCIFDTDLQNFRIDNEVYDEEEIPDAIRLVYEYIQSHKQELNELREERQRCLAHLSVINQKIDRILCIR